MNSDLLISKLLETGYLTEEKIHKHHLRPVSVAHVLKAYAIHTKTPFKINVHNYHIYKDERLFLTTNGFDWFLNVLSKYKLDYLRHAFPNLFLLAKEEDITNPDYAWYRNFKGLSGEKLPPGSKQRAVLVQERRRMKREYEFASLFEARAYIKTLNRYQGLEGYTLFRIRKHTKNGKVYYYREKVPLLVEERPIRNNIERYYHDKRR